MCLASNPLLRRTFLLKLSLLCMLIVLQKSCHFISFLPPADNPVGDLSGTSLMQCLGRYPGRLWDLDLARTNVGLQTIKVRVGGLRCKARAMHDDRLGPGACERGDADRSGGGVMGGRDVGRVGR